MTGEQAKRHAGYRVIALTVSTSIFVQFLDATALNTALPAIARDLHVPAIDLNLILLAYQLALACCIPAAAFVSSRLGARNTFTAALGVFMLGSLLCALSNSLPELVAARVVQGIGGAAMAPVGRLLVVRSAEKSELISAMNWLTIPGVIGPMLGPGVGGLIVTYSSWHWIFLVNIPVALVGMAMTMTLVPNDRADKGVRLDTGGLLLLGPAMCGLVLGLEGASGTLFGSMTAALLSGSLLFFALYVRHARTVAEPVIDLSLLAIPSFRHSMISGTMLRTIAAAASFMLPLWFQLAMGLSAARTGALMMLFPVGLIASRALGGLLFRWNGPRGVMIIGIGLLAIALLLCSALDPKLPPVLFGGALFLVGLGFSVPMLVIGAVGYVDIPPERMGAATAFYTTVQQLSQSLGVALGVWTISVMLMLTHSTAQESAGYVGSQLMFSALTVVALLSALKLDDESTAVLDPRNRRKTI
jgi:EmrB/QacA subfamily drug resistance transporter